MTNLKTLIAKLDPLCRQAAERAASITLSHGHHEVDIEHLLLALLENPRSDLVVACRRWGVATEALQADLQRELARLRNGNTRTPVFGTRLLTLLEQAWLIASLDTLDPRIRSAHLLLALLTEPTLSQLAQRSSPASAR
jgi:type VI secretion system protein VasG